MTQYETKVVNFFARGEALIDIKELEKLIARMGQEGWQCMGPLTFRENPDNWVFWPASLLFQRPTLGHPFRSEGGG